ncbi:SMP-30/gluconolactonase/LRE family protein [Vibrio lamellibrachiae]|uniref:SMP-30/gluconolactonase/LRE family protein n=1 Tax=Vibrio lamellibrachiae TaxID=2910253 RepID=UPI003D0A7908
MRVANNISNTIGESPIWNVHTQSLVWVDAAGSDIHEYFPLNGTIKSYEVPFEITAIVPCDNQHWVCASKQGLFLASPELDNFTLITDPFAQFPHLHCNDAVASPNGQLWLGSMNCQDLESPDGKLFQFNQKQVQTMDAEFSVANGICFNHHLKRAYCSNMFQKVVFEYQLNDDMTEIIDKTIFVKFDDLEGLPDGLCSDRYGNIYICHWDNGKVSYYMPSPNRIGNPNKLGEVKLPVKHATRCTFGGEYLDTLFVTTANYELTPTEKELYPHSGQLFILNAPTKGKVEPTINSALL